MSSGTLESPASETTSATLRVTVAHMNPSTRQAIVDALEELNHTVVQVCGTGIELIATSNALQPDLIVTGVDLPDLDGISALLEVSRNVAIPAIVVTPRRSIQVVKRALQDHVMAYLLEPFQKEEIMPTVYLVLKRFQQFEDLRNEVKELKQTLENRKVIERAKGVLMSRERIDEENAFARLRRMATNGRIKLIAAAQLILDQQQDGSHDTPTYSD